MVFSARSGSTCSQPDFILNVFEGIIGRSLMPEQTFHCRLAREGVAAAIVVCVLLPIAASAVPDNLAGDEKSAFQRALPAEFFNCTSDSQCVIVQGWCATFAIKKSALKTFDQIPSDPAGKGARGCPPGWFGPVPSYFDRSDIRPLPLHCVFVET